MNLDSRATNAVGRITNPWNEPLPTPNHVKAQAAAIGHLVLAACRGIEWQLTIVDVAEGMQWQARSYFTKATTARLGWKPALMEDLTPLLHKLAQGREISGLAAYEQ